MSANRFVRSDSSAIQKPTSDSVKLSGAFGDLLFVILPLVILGLVVLKRDGSIVPLLTSPDWSYGTVVLFGQAIVRLAAGLVADPRKRSSEPITLVLSGTIAALAISLTVLVFMLTSPAPAVWLIVLQIVLFWVAAVVYVVFAAAGGVYQTRGQLDG